MEIRVRSSRPYLNRTQSEALCERSLMYIDWIKLYKFSYKITTHLAELFHQTKWKFNFNDSISNSILAISLYLSVEGPRYGTE